MNKIEFKNLPDMTTPLSAENLNQLQDNMEDAIVPIKLVSVGATAPATATIGDMYYNTTDNKIYTATAENTWDSGDTPRYDGFYVNKENNTIHYYNGETLSGVNSVDTTPVGMIMPYAGTTIPEKWMKCEGQALSRTDYSALFSAIGTTYGDGDGTTTFNVPNLQGRFPIGMNSNDNDFNMLGATGGNKTHTQTVEELASHTHPSPKGGNFVEDRGTGIDITTSRGTDFATKTTIANTGATGSSKPMDIMNPYIVFNYCIKAL